jgi:hypothetical protein
LALLFKHPIRRAIMSLAFWAFSWIALFLGLAVIASGYWRTPYYVLPLLFLYSRIVRGRSRTRANLVAIALGMPMAAYLLIRSAVAHKHDRITWKGRSYVSGQPRAVVGGLHDRTTNIA